MARKSRKRYLRGKHSWPVGRDSLFFELVKREVIQFYEEAEREDPLQCYYCGRVTLPRERHVDHAKPLAKGGGHAAENLVIACPTCNLRKGDKTPEEYRAWLASDPYRPKCRFCGDRIGSTSGPVKRCRKCYFRHMKEWGPHNTGEALRRMEAL